MYSCFHFNFKHLTSVEYFLITGCFKSFRPVIHGTSIHYNKPVKFLLFVQDILVIFHMHKGCIQSRLTIVVAPLKAYNMPVIGYLAFQKSPEQFPVPGGFFEVHFSVFNTKIERCSINDYSSILQRLYSFFLPIFYHFLPIPITSWTKYNAIASIRRFPFSVKPCISPVNTSNFPWAYSSAAFLPYSIGTISS